MYAASIAINPAYPPRPTTRAGLADWTLQQLVRTDKGTEQYYSVSKQHLQFPRTALQTRTLPQEQVRVQSLSQMICIIISLWANINSEDLFRFSALGLALCVFSRLVVTTSSLTRLLPDSLTFSLCCIPSRQLRSSAEKRTCHICPKLKQKPLLSDRSLVVPQSNGIFPLLTSVTLYLVLPCLQNRVKNSPLHIILKQEIWNFVFFLLSPLYLLPSHSPLPLPPP